MSAKLTEAQFSMQCAFIAKNAAAWAGDLLTLSEHYGREANPQTVGRFTDEMRERLDRLDKWAGRSPAPATNVTGLADAIAERLRQREVEGWTPDHDDTHSRGELARAAACYALQAAQRCDVTPYDDLAGRRRWRIVNWAIKRFWPWGWGWWKPRDSRHDLIRGAALIIAEIERLDRASLATTEGSDNGR